MHKISVCVPAYNRPDTLRQLINSYLHQDYKNRELIISDDTPNDSVKKLVDSYKNNSIKYFHNKPSLRFAKNLLMCMKMAKGDYVIVLGDDDVLLRAATLSDYVKVFRKYPKVGFVYSNIVQFSPDMDIQYIINFTNVNKMYKKGEESMKYIWPRSLFIGGMGIRNKKDIYKFFPAKKVLYPQVEFVGHIANNFDTYLLKDHNIGFRSHDDQIIFNALKNKSIQQQGNHTVIEFFEIFEKLRKRYNLAINSDFLAKELINLQSVMMFKEKTNLGVKGMEYYYKEFQKLSTVVKNSKKLKAAFLVAKYTPSSFITVGRKMTLGFLKKSKRKEIKRYKKSLDHIIS